MKRQDVLQADLRAERHALAKAVRAGLCIGSTAVMLSISSVGLSQSSFSPVLELSALDGSDGFVINGIDSGDYSGRSVSGAGDINGDGVADVIIGASSAAPNGSFSGESYVVFGSGSVGSTGTIELSDLDGSNGFVINGIDASDFSGSSVSAAGDINDDGVADLIIGAAGADPNGNSGAGESYVLFGGSAVGTGGTFELSALDGTSGFVINGINSNDYSGEVCGAGDISGDNVADLIIGAPRAYSNGNYAAGQSYVVFGGDLVGSSAGLELSALDGSDGFVIDGIDFFDGSGSSVSGAGDINGDNVADLIIGTDVDTNFYPGATGESYVVFGGGGVGLTGEIELSALDGSNGFVINGIGAGDASGGSVSDAGDVNGDGVADLIVGAIFADPNGNSAAGESYVVFGGSAVGGSGTIELSALDGSDGFVLNGIDNSDFTGASVSSAGDVNGDGVTDLFVGANGADPNGASNAGESYLVFGGVGLGSSGVLELSGLDGTNGFVISGIDASDLSGASVSDAGDVNGDGATDLIIGAARADPNGNAQAGESYVVFGLAPVQILCNGLPVTVNLNLGQTPGPGDDVVMGTPGNDDIRGRAGNDTICGMGGNDFIHGNSGDDWIDGGDGIDNIRGGQGNDILFSGSGATVGTSSRVFGGTGEDIITGGPDADDLRGGRDNDMISGLAGADTIVGNDGNDNLSGGAGADTLTGGQGNDELFGEGGSDSLNGGSGGNDFCDGGGQGGDTDVNCEVF